jgi:hypothetical protein
MAWREVVEKILALFAAALQHHKTHLIINFLSYGNNCSFGKTSIKEMVKAN